MTAHLTFGQSLALYRVLLPNGVVVKAANGTELDAIISGGHAARWQAQQIVIRVEEVER